MTTTKTSTGAPPKAQWICKGCYQAAEKTDANPPKVFSAERDWNAATFWTLCPKCAKPFEKRSLKIELTPEEAFLFDRFCREGNETYRAKLTPELIVKNFIRDFLGAAGNNGSDEREFANQWFERTWMAFPKEGGAR